MNPVYTCECAAVYRPGPGPPGQPGQPGQPGARPDDPDQRPDEGVDRTLDSDTDTTTTKVRSNFPETWIWTETTTGCVIPTTVVHCCYKSICTNVLCRFVIR